MTYTDYRNKYLCEQCCKPECRDCPTVPTGSVGPIFAIILFF